VNKSTGEEWVGKRIAFPEGLRIGDNVLVEDCGGALVGRVLEPWEPIEDQALLFRIEPGVKGTQLRMCRVRRQV
jgi:hypothetical protein